MIIIRLKTSSNLLFNRWIQACPYQTTTHLSTRYVQQVFKGPLSGQLFETIVLSEVIKSFWNKGKIPKIFWWRTSYGEEVDFIIEDKGKIIPVEVKLSSKANTQMVQGLRNFCNLFADRVDKAFLVNLSGEKVILDEKITAVPFGEFVSML